MRRQRRAGTWLATGIAVAVVASLPAAAGAGGQTDSFAGSCSLQVTVTFTPPATNNQQPLTISDTGDGTCTGTLNGRQVSDAPVKALAGAHDVDGSCLRARTTTPGQGSVTFAGGETIRFAFDFDFTGTEGSFVLRGERSGTAHGHGSFLTQRTPPDLAVQCAGDGAREAPLDITVTTDSPLVSSRGEGASPPQPGSSPPPRRLSFSVHPGSAEAGRRTRFTFHVARPDGRPARGALVRFAGRRARTGPRGGVRIVATLPRPGQWNARASKRGFPPEHASVAAHARQGEQGADRPSSFSGSCKISGEVAFTPPLTNDAQTVYQQVEAPGTCSGTFVDARGRSHDMSDSPVTYLASGRAEQSSCGSGAATETGSLVFTWDDIAITVSERRGGGEVIASIAGAKSGSATATAGISQSEDPVQILQKCAGPGLDRARIDGQATTADTLTG